MTEREMALRYAPIVHFDRNETIPLRAVGYTVFQKTEKSRSFPKRMVTVPENAAFVVEYAYYWDYDIDHMYDLEHIWVTVDHAGHVMAAEGSFHGKYLTLLVPELHGATPPTEEHVHAYCQPGKHAFLPVGELFRLVPGWFECCSTMAGGPVLIGGPFEGKNNADGRNRFTPTAEDDAHSVRYLREQLAFTPTLDFSQAMPENVIYMTWEDMFAWIPGQVEAECARLRRIYAE